MHSYSIHEHTGHSMRDILKCGLSSGNSDRSTPGAFSLHPTCVNALLMPSAVIHDGQAFSNTRAKSARVGTYGNEKNVAA